MRPKAEGGMQQVLEDGSAIRKLKAMVAAQGGNASWIDDTESFPKAACVTPFIAEKDGYIEQVRALEIGRLAMEIGAGRERKEDAIQPETGIVLGKRPETGWRREMSSPGFIITGRWTFCGRNGCMAPLCGAIEKQRRNS